MKYVFLTLAATFFFSQVSLASNCKKKIVNKVIQQYHGKNLRVEATWGTSDRYTRYSFVAKSNNKTLQCRFIVTDRWFHYGPDSTCAIAQDVYCIDPHATTPSWW